MNGLPLLSHPPPENSDGSDDSTCRRCNKDFNFIFARPKRCNHCGYAYCSSCADFQALMPRDSPETGYDVQAVCAYCMDMLTVTASGKSKLKSLPLAKLRTYMEAYNITTGGGALEKDDLVEAIIRSKAPNGCLLPSHEEYYRKYSVPRKSNERPRARTIFSRPSRPSMTSSTPPLSQQQYPPAPPPGAGSAHARRGPPQPPQPPHVPYSQSQSHSHDHNPHRTQTPYYHQRPPPSPHQFHPPPPHTTNARPSASQTNLHPNPPSSYSSPRPPNPPPRPRSAAPTVRATHASPPPPVPSLDSLLEKSSNEISNLSISTLKAVLFENRVKSSMGILEKDDLVQKVLALVREEKRDREIAKREEQEEAERMQWARKEREKQEKERKAEEEERKLIEERLRRERESRTDESSKNEADKPMLPPPSANANVAYAEKVQEGLCVVCCDAHANMAIIDCGHLALCKACSEIVMNTTRECPLCRTRIVTEQRLLRIFKT